MSKKKNFQAERKLRREVEILRAQLKSQTDTSASRTIFIPAVQASAPAKKEEKYTLPILAIRKDLVKTFLFALFAFGMIAVISISNFKI